MVGSTAAPPALKLGDELPNFSLATTHGQMALHDFIGDQWCVLMSHPVRLLPLQ
jgi:alkyl hydroperoxide reductase subunit AhpC